MMIRGENKMNILMIVLAILIILLIVVLFSMKQSKDKGVIKSEIVDYKIVQEKNTPHTHVYEVKVQDKKRPVTLSIDKSLQLEKGQIMTYKVINKKPRFIMLEQKLNEESKEDL